MEADRCVYIMYRSIWSPSLKKKKKKKESPSNSQTVARVTYHGGTIVNECVGGDGHRGDVGNTSTRSVNGFEIKKRK